MAEKNYAFIKGNDVVNIVVFDNPTQELLDSFIELHKIDSIIDTRDNIKAAVGGTFDGTDFILPRPYPSWTLDGNKDWQPPIEYPTDGKLYAWDEDAQMWKEYTRQ